MPMRCLWPPEKAWGSGAHVIGRKADLGQKAGDAIAQFALGRKMACIPRMGGFGQDFEKGMPRVEDYV